MTAPRMKTPVSALFLCVQLVCACVAYAGVDQPLYAVDSPTAGLLADGEYHVRGRVGPQSSILTSARIGFFNVVQLGVSFGMQRVFERGDITVNDQVGFAARIRVLQEYATPALAIGFDSQGVGIYNESLDRYERKSPGFYGVLSKNWSFPVGQVSLHGGLNYSLESTDEDGFDMFGAWEWLMFRGLSVILDGDAAINDNRKDGLYGGGGIYLDGAVRLNYGESVSMMLIFRDLTGNYEPHRQVAREFELALVNSF
jgi:hypothetical protein